jgi:hypothetical protein
VGEALQKFRRRVVGSIKAARCLKQESSKPGGQLEDGAPGGLTMAAMSHASPPSAETSRRPVDSGQEAGRCAAEGARVAMDDHRLGGGPAGQAVEQAPPEGVN